MIFFQLIIYCSHFTRIHSLASELSGGDAINCYVFAVKYARNFERMRVGGRKREREINTNIMDWSYLNKVVGNRHFGVDWPNMVAVILHYYWAHTANMVAVVQRLHVAVGIQHSYY